MEQVKLELKNALKFYVSGREITLALNYVSLSFESGEFVVVTGESGSGKSTMAHVLAGVIPCNQGEVVINDQGTLKYSEAEWEEYRKSTISFVAQNYGILLGNTVWDNVICGLTLAGVPRKEAKKRAKELLQKVDLWKLRHRRAAKLSSGQKQRLSVARAVAKPAPVLIADEPTSNLDWGTAEKIIELLGEAAKDRLVIVVTHNYESMKQVANRHLVMKDGEIVKDEKIKPDEVIEETAEKVTSPLKEKKIKKNVAGYIARLQLKSRPVWTLLMVIFFAATAFAVFVFLGNFLRVMDDTSARFYSAEAFLNGIETRLVVSRQDGELMKEEDFKTLIAVPRVAHLERYDVLQDINYHYQQDKDYIISIESSGDPMFGPITYTRRIILTDSHNFMQTVPVLPEGKEFLKAGRVPEHFNEVVAAGSVSQIGQQITVYLHNPVKWAVEDYHVMNVTVVGVTDYGTGLYFNDRLGTMFEQTSLSAWMIGETYYGVDPTLDREDFSEVPRNVKIQKATQYEKTEEGEFEAVEVEELPKLSISSKLLTSLYNSRNVPITDYVHLYNMNTGKRVPVDIETNTKTNLLRFYGMSEELFDEVSIKSFGTQCSVYLEDYSYADRVIADLEELGYDAISPYRLGSIIEDNALEKERMASILISLAAVFVVIAAQVVVLAAMFQLQMGDYQKLRNLGLVYKTGKRSLAVQIALFTVLGQLFAASLLYVGAKKGIEYFVNIVKYIEPVDAVMLSATHIAASILVACFVAHMLRKKVFAFTAVRNDLDLAELEQTDRQKGAAHE